jgi:hypothetical protein
MKLFPHVTSIILSYVRIAAASSYLWERKGSTLLMKSLEILCFIIISCVPDFHVVFSRSPGTDTAKEVVMVYEVPDT